jgi:hypothetical protein
MTTAALPKLRPLGLGELLDHSIRLYRRQFVTFLGIIAIVQIPISLIQLAWSAYTLSQVGDELLRPSDPSNIFFNSLGGTTGFLGTMLIAVISFVLVQGVATAALTRAIADGYLGEKIGILEAYRRIGRSWGSLLGALLVAAVLGVALFVWMVIPCVGWLTGPGMLLFYALVVVPLVAPSVVLEKQSAGQAVFRAWDLARRRFWWVLAFVLILAIFQWVIVSGPAGVANFLAQSLIGDGPLDLNRSSSEIVLQTSVQSAVTLLFSLLYLPLQLTAITLMYFDLRVRNEGFDLALMAESASETPEVAAEVIARAPKPDQRSVLTMDEMGYFVLATVGAVALFFILYAVLAVLGLAMLATMS